MSHSPETKNSNLPSAALGGGIGKTQTLREMYERFPYPPVTYEGHKLTVPWLLEHLFDSLSGKALLDFGCGTGKKLVAFAEAFPDASFTGIDMSASSLERAAQVVKERGVTNVRLRQGTLLEMEIGETFDVIVATGVVHHFEKPAEGLRRLAKALKPDGIIVLTLYHPFGCFRDLRMREMLQLLMGERKSDFAYGVDLLKDLSTAPFGTTPDAIPLDARVDALLNPIVHAYRLEECEQLVRQAGLDWCAWDFLLFGQPLDKRVLDLSNRLPATESAIRSSELFPRSPLCQEAFEKLPLHAKLGVAELALCPHISGVLAGYTASFEALPARVKGNASRCAG